MNELARLASALADLEGWSLLVTVAGGFVGLLLAPAALLEWLDRR